MATGKLGAVDLAATTDTILYTAPVAGLATVNLNMCNRGAVNVKIRIAILDGAIGTLTNADYVEFDLNLAAKGVIERTGLVVSNGASIMVYSDSIDVSAVCWGFEE